MIANYNADQDFEQRARRLIERELYARIAWQGRYVSLVGDSAGIRFLQREAHIDVILQVSSFHALTIEEKIVRGHYTAFTIETHSNVERNKLGWIYTSTADRLVYAFTIPGGLEVWSLPLPQLREWFVPREQSFPKSDTPNGWDGKLAYHTRCRIVPIRDIPCPKRVFQLRENS